MGNLTWALIAARSDLLLAMEMVAANADRFPDPFKKDGEFFARAHFFRSTLVSLSSVRWLLNALMGEAEFRKFVRGSNRGPEFLEAKGDLDRAYDLISRHRGQHGAHVERDFAESRDRIDDDVTMPIEVTEKGLSHRAASQVIAAAMLENHRSADLQMVEFLSLIKRLSEAAGRAAQAIELALVFYFQARLPR